jgi:acyl-CoA reductase-like NAD-dependent aldehyde dehydrogenase
MPRLAVPKTFKLYINGAFPRTESGRFDPALAADGTWRANAPRASRKDFREAVKHARAGLGRWAGATAYLRGQILYRIAEMLEGRSAQFERELTADGRSAAEARAEVAAAVDRLVHYAGWTDKIRQVFGTVNPVSSSHFNFSVPEPTGVVAILAPDTPALLGLVSLIAPVIAGGNTCIALVSSAHPLAGLTLGEVLHASDLPAGVVNLLAGRRSELAAPFASHMDVNAIVSAGGDATERKMIEETAVGNLKRVIDRSGTDWFAPTAQSPYAVLDTQEIKTTWHPVGL